MFYKYKSTLVALFSTLFILFIFQCGANITAPGITVNNETLSGLSQMLNLFGGGGLRRASFFAIGISPYITAQIIIQLLSNDVVKHFSDLRQMGESGRYKLELYTRLLTLPFAIMTSLGTLHVLSVGGSISFQDVYNNFSTSSSFSSLHLGQRSMMVILFVAGTYVTLFLSDIISKKGLGNGITLIIMSGIIASLPENFVSAYEFFAGTNTPTNTDVLATVSSIPKTILKFFAYVFCYLLTLILIIFINGSVRKIPVQQIGPGIILQKKQLSYLPIKLMPAGIIPVVFAGSMMMFPAGIAELVKNQSPAFSEFVFNYLSLNSVYGLMIYFALIVLFSFFYSQIQINTEEITRNFQKQSQFIPGVRSGQPTYNYLNSVINRINWFGAPFLACVAILPNLLNFAWDMPHNIALGGTGIIIIVSGSLQVYDELKTTHIISKYQVNKDWENKNNIKKSSEIDNLLW